MTTEYRLTPRMAEFAREYVATGNAAASVRKSGYSASGATAQGVRLLAKVSVQHEIARLTALRDSETDVDRRYVVNKLQDIVENGEKESNRLRAIELLGKSLRLFVEKVDVQHTVEITELQGFSLHKLLAMREVIGPAIEADARLLDS